jgi:hypothetical protein
MKLAHLWLRVAIVAFILRCGNRGPYRHCVGLIGGDA